MLSIMVAIDTNIRLKEIATSTDAANTDVPFLGAMLRATEQLKTLGENELRSLVQKASDASVSDDPHATAKLLTELAHAIVEQHEPRLNEIFREPNVAGGEPEILLAERTLFLPKLSKIECDMLHNELDLEALLHKYDQEGLDTDRILSAHKNHRASVEKLKVAFSDGTWMQSAAIEITELKAAIAEADLIVVVGGDDYFKFLNQYLDGKLVTVVNSDTAHSDGAAAYFDADSLGPFMEAAKQGAYVVEEWQRLRVTVNGQEYPTAVSEVAIAEEQFKMSSRGSYVSDTAEGVFKGSGIIIGTGYGSKGWLRSASRHIFPPIEPWERTRAYGHLVEREPHGEVRYPDYRHEGLEPGQELLITSGMNHNGVLTIDSIIDVPFPRGAKAVISLADKPIKIVRKR